MGGNQKIMGITNEQIKYLIKNLEEVLTLGSIEEKDEKIKILINIIKNSSGN